LFNIHSGSWLLDSGFFETLISHARENPMSISRKIGILVVFGVPAIIGGGIIYAIFQSYTPVVVYEILLGFTVLGFISR
jgi:hypothetical protein